MKFLNNFNWFGSMPSEDDIFNVKKFNIWFNDPDNNADYANPGIFLRLDKLTEYHIDDYLLKCYGEKVYKKYSTRKYYYLRYAFYTQVLGYWRILIEKENEN